MKTSVLTKSIKSDQIKLKGKKLKEGKKKPFDLPFDPYQKTRQVLI